MRELANGGASRAVTGWHPPKQVYIPDNEIIIYAIGITDALYTFTLNWEPIELGDIPEAPGNTTAPAGMADCLIVLRKPTSAKEYDCGGTLHPSWEWQSLKNPLAATSSPHDLRGKRNNDGV